MRLSIESDGTLQGTTFEFHMTADEIPRMVERRRQRKLQLKRLGPSAAHEPGAREGSSSRVPQVST